MDNGELSTGVGIPTRSPPTPSWERPSKTPTKPSATRNGDNLHNNPVKRGLVKEPGDWPWSSWRSYFLRNASLLAMDRAP
jgi:hypothetical protein